MSGLFCVRKRESPTQKTTPPEGGVVKVLANKEMPDDATLIRPTLRATQYWSLSNQLPLTIRVNPSTGRW